MKELEQLNTILKQHAISITKPRQAVFETLRKIDEPAKASVIAKQTPDVNRASVYRTLKLFNQLNITSTIVRGWIPFIELAEPFKPHHHHILCSKCSRVVSIKSQELERHLEETAKKHGFILQEHTVELSGLCNECCT